MNLMLCQRSNKWPCSRLTVWSRTSTRSRPVLTAKQVKCGPSLRAQILCENIMESGEKKLEMVTLKVHTEAFKKLVGQKVRIPVGAFVNKGAIMFYALKTKRNPSRHLERKSPRTLETVPGVAGFY